MCVCVCAYCMCVLGERGEDLKVDESKSRSRREITD